MDLICLKMELLGAKITFQLCVIIFTLNMLTYTINSIIQKEKKMPLNIVSLWRQDIRFYLFNFCIYASSPKRIRTLRIWNCTCIKKRREMFHYILLINPESSYYLNAGQSTLGFYHRIENCYVVNKDIPNFAVAYPETDICNLLNKYGLEIINKPHYGLWCGRHEYTSYQDIVLTKKLLKGSYVWWMKKSTSRFHPYSHL